VEHLKLEPIMHILKFKYNTFFSISLANISIDEMTLEV